VGDFIRVVSAVMSFCALTVNTTGSLARKAFGLQRPWSLLHNGSVFPQKWTKKTNGKLVIQDHMKNG